MNNSNTAAPDVAGLFSAAHNDDTISTDTAAIFSTFSVQDLGQKIGNAMGIPADQFKQNEVVLIGIRVDDSGSIRMAGNSPVMRDGVNAIIDALNGTSQTQQNNILLYISLLSGKIIMPFGSLKNAVRLDTHNYNPDEGTPLYDSYVEFLGAMLAKTQEFADQGVPVRSISCICTDGADQHSRRFKAADGKKVARDMLLTEKHIITGLGISDGGTDFRDIFSQMGIPDGSPDAKGQPTPDFILTPGNNASEIRKAFATVSKSAVRTSQSAASFSQQAAGGFGA